MGWLDTILGRAPAPQPVVPAPPLSEYPSDEDARFARASGFGYGTGAEPFIEGKTARVFGTLVPANPKKPKGATVFSPESAAGLSTGMATTPQLSGLVDLGDPKNAETRDKLGMLFARAALAANRSPVAAVGFDPRQAQIDTKIGRSTVGGVYNPALDTMYATAVDPSALVHESMHRGMKALRAVPETADAFKALPDEESVVRYLMAKQAGDPEGGGGSIDKRQRETGLTLMDTRARQDALKQIEAVAQRLIALRQPMGPR